MKTLLSTWRRTPALNRAARMQRFLRIILVLWAAIIFGAGDQVVAATQTGKVAYPSLGIEFNVPQGWIGQETADGFMMGSNTEAGLILLSTHAHKDMNALKQEAAQGIVQEGSIMLQKSGEFAELGTQAAGAEFSGVVDGQAAKAYVAGVINPHGLGVTILALTSAQAYSPRYKQLVTEIVKSLRFSKPVEAPVVAEWRQTLAGAKLTYLESYTSSGPSVGGYSTGGGYSNSNVIALCRNGTFTESGSNSLSVDTGGAFGSSSGSNQGSGSWAVVGNVSGGATLQLRYLDGSVAEYELDYRDNKTFLNGTRYFRTNDAGC